MMNYVTQTEEQAEQDREIRCIRVYGLSEYALYPNNE